MNRDVVCDQLDSLLKDVDVIKASEYYKLNKEQVDEVLDLSVHLYNAFLYNLKGEYIDDSPGYTKLEAPRWVRELYILERDKVDMIFFRRATLDKYITQTYLLIKDIMLKISLEPLTCPLHIN